ncbi:cupredoxin domain-containing protein [Glaciecola sp. XM2]|uniref:cupredoxin domain-containing protein n=1 Tax=Glaciecola sp. XM2 TaxID=1914931 RepID=UPI001BDEAE7A|nr:cupredoxin domain-containing protein [Glaciecola sp. XM2]MBT1449302.1 cupredoxin domain-containing protein [Glaciecola sp. XM2]
MQWTTRIVIAASITLASGLMPVIAEETKVFALVLKNHTFMPATLTIPANEKVKIIIENKDDTAEEFDSFDLNRERVIFAGKSATIYVGPLPPGTYEYFGEYHPNSARGQVIVSEERP